MTTTTRNRWWVGAREDEVTATYVDGILEITVPVPRAAATEVAVTVADPD